MVSHDDVAQTIDTFRFMAGAARSITSQASADYAESHLSVILREPLGVIGVVTPWNYPLLMAAWKMAPILAAGNVLVLKPSEQTPLTTLKFAELVADLLPAGVFNVVTGYGSVVGNRLSGHPQIDMIALTGSANSGKALAHNASESLKRVHLELGGKAPVIIFDGANLDEAATALRAAGYWNSGQECGAGCRVLVHESVAAQFTDHLVREVGSLVVGEPGAGDDVEIGPLISKVHFERVCGFLDRARAQGIRAALGGTRDPRPRILRRAHRAHRRARQRRMLPRGDFRTGHHRRDLHRRNRRRRTRQRRSLRPGRVGADRERPTRPRHPNATGLRHRLGQRPPGARQCCRDRAKVAMSGRTLRRMLRSPGFVAKGYRYRR